MRSLLCLALLAGCTNPVTVVGVVTDGPTDKARVVPDATVRIIDDGGFVFDEATTDDDGAFKVGAPRGAQIYAVIDGDGLTPASFSGVSGFSSRLVVPRGQLFAVSEAVRTSWEFAYRGCPGIGDGAGLVIGQVRALEVIDDATGEHPPLSHAAAHTESHAATGEATVEATGCYLDAAGAAFDPAATATGDDGWYAIPSVTPGLHTLVVELDIGAGATQASFFEVWMPEGGVAPRFPTYVETPF